MGGRRQLRRGAVSRGPQPAPHRERHVLALRRPTTSTFSQQAKDFAGFVNARLVLVDGRQLSRLMIEYDVGVTVRRTYQLKRVDQDYFATGPS